tara:strand:+ start:14979 stop:15215 length:237 start_codon:yes stop_codon:yes gene_type:complete
MAMDKDRLGTNITAAIAALHGSMSPAQITALEPFWKTIADEFIKEVKNNMTFTTTVTVPGVQAGASTVPATGVENVIL